MKKYFLFLLLFLASLAVFSLSAHAVVIESGIPGGVPDPNGLQPGANATSTPAEYIRYVYIFVMGFVGIAGLVTLVIWGTMWTASGIVDKKAAAMEGIKNTLIGIGIALTAYLLLYTINPDLTIIRTPTVSSVSLTNTQNTASAPGCVSGINAKTCSWVDMTNASSSLCSDVLSQPTAVNAPQPLTNYCAGTPPNYSKYTCCLVY